MPRLLFARSSMGLLEKFARRATAWTGSSWAFALAILTIVVWGLTGPIFGYSDTWQLVINTGTTIVTFLMVFLLQRSQNKDSLAVHLKLNELVAAIEGASNRLINVEEMSENDVAVLKRYYNRLVELARQDEKLTECHSIEEAAQRHLSKRRRSAGKSREKATAIEAAAGVAISPGKPGTSQ
ncbi:MAG TPA: low affinity iron permease family protein [Gemmataceae bacterium]|jgi:low affinity Fe/Cu permease|nr:low affinity iron permease family protein [Gemmataceae bacterium]